MRHRCYLIVEGPHDLEFTARILKLINPKIKRVKLERDLDPYWKDLIPKKFPHEGDLLKRVPLPVFFQSEDYSVAVHAANGLEAVAKCQEESLAVLPAWESELHALGICLDSDDIKTPAERVERMAAELHTVAFPTTPGQILAGMPKTGIYVFPDNQSPGTLEDVLLDCAGVGYPELSAITHQFMTRVDGFIPKLNSNDRKDVLKPAGRKKAEVGVIGTILRPGKSIQVSIQDNGWVGKKTAHLAGVRSYLDFVAALLQATPDADLVSTGV